MTQQTNRQSVDTLIKSICDIMRSGNMAGALQYIPELSWLLFLRILDEKEQDAQTQADALGGEHVPLIPAPYRWRDWAAKDGKKRAELVEASGNALLHFVNNDLLPHMKAYRNSANLRQKVVSQMFAELEKTRFGTQRELLDVLDKLDVVRERDLDNTHVFAVSQVYENLLLKMGEKNNDGGQFFTPREVIRAMVQTVAPKPGERVYDPCCGTGGFLVQAYEYMSAGGGKLSVQQRDKLETATFYGREKDAQIYPIALANAVLHGIDVPRIWHGNALTERSSNDTLYPEAEQGELHDVILTNPPFGGKEAEDAQTRFDYKTSKTQVLFLQDVIEKLRPGGRCGIVVDEGLLFQTNDRACMDTRRRLLQKCDLWCIISLPKGVFTGAGSSGVKTNILFFNKRGPTKTIWYYDMSHLKVNKRQPLLLAQFADFFALRPQNGNPGQNSQNSWSVNIAAIQANNYDIKAVNPNRKTTTDPRTPAQLLTDIAQAQNLIATALNRLK